jgi:DNA repair protein RadD
MYRTFLTAAQTINPQLRVIGLTATPFRLQAGPICLPPPEGILNSICYEAGVKELIQAGYLAPLKSKAGVQKPDLSRLHVRQGEFVAEEVELAMNQDPLVYAACREIAHYMRDRKSCLLFASSIAHGRKIADTIRQVAAQECGFLDGDSASLFRAATIDRFRDGSLKYLCNVNVLTTGFDAPNIDCIALLRPTLSAGLFYQMVGRGLRLFPGKADCLILDFAGNILRHGPIDQIRINKPCKAGSGEAPAKECTACHALLACGYGVCPDCGYVFPPSDKPLHDAEATDEGILSGQVMQTVYEVRDVFYSVHAKKDADPEAPKTMRVDYRVGLFQRVSEWICFEHAGWPRRKAEEWWRQRSSDPVPASAQQAVDIAEAGGVATPKTIAVRSVAGEKFDRIVGYELGEKPEAVLQTFPTSSPDDEIPF